MASESCITFYDIPGSLDCKAWSPNTWRARFVLNCKAVEYKTIWVEYPDIEPLCKELGIEPTAKKADGRDHYTCPAICDPTGGSPKFISDSLKIADYLDEKYPETAPLFPNGTRGLQMVYVDNVKEMMAPLVDFTISESYKQLNPASQPYFRTTREARFGKKMEEICPAGPEREAVYAAAQTKFSKLASIMADHGAKGPFILGNQVSFADIYIGSMLIWFKIVSEKEVWARLSKWDDGRWDKLLAVLEAKYGKVV